MIGGDGRAEEGQEVQALDSRHGTHLTSTLDLRNPLVVARGSTERQGRDASCSKSARLGRLPTKAGGRQAWRTKRRCIVTGPDQRGKKEGRSGDRLGAEECRIRDGRRMLKNETWPGESSLPPQYSSLSLNPLSDSSCPKKANALPLVPPSASTDRPLSLC